MSLKKNGCCQERPFRNLHAATYKCESLLQEAKNNGLTSRQYLSGEPGNGFDVINLGTVWVRHEKKGKTGGITRSATLKVKTTTVTERHWVFYINRDSEILKELYPFIDVARTIRPTPIELGLNLLTWDQIIAECRNQGATLIIGKNTTGQSGINMKAGRKVYEMLQSAGINETGKTADGKEDSFDVGFLNNPERARGGRNNDDDADHSSGDEDGNGEGTHDENSDESSGNDADGNGDEEKKHIDDNDAVDINSEIYKRDARESFNTFWKTIEELRLNKKLDETLQTLQNDLDPTLKIQIQEFIGIFKEIDKREQEALEVWLMILGSQEDNEGLTKGQIRSFFQSNPNMKSLFNIGNGLDPDDSEKRRGWEANHVIMDEDNDNIVDENEFVVAYLKHELKNRGRRVLIEKYEQINRHVRYPNGYDLFNEIKSLLSEPREGDIVMLANNSSTVDIESYDSSPKYLVLSRDRESIEELTLWDGTSGTKSTTDEVIKLSYLAKLEQDIRQIYANFNSKKSSNHELSFNQEEFNAFLAKYPLSDIVTETFNQTDTNKDKEITQAELRYFLIKNPQVLAEYHKTTRVDKISLNNQTIYRLRNGGQVLAFPKGICRPEKK